MALFFPGNAKRHDRLIELSADSQRLLNQVKTNYQAFIGLNATVNEQIAQIYAKANLIPPATTNVDILATAGAVGTMSTADTAVAISNMFVGIVGFTGTVAYLAPGATAFLVETGVMEAETAATVLMTVLGADLTVGVLAGGIIGGIIAGVIVTTIGIAIDAIEGAILRDKLRHGIHQMDQIRVSFQQAATRSEILVRGFDSIRQSLETLLNSNLPLSDAIIQNVITHDAQPTIDAANAVTFESAVVQLQQLDQSRHSWTHDDVEPHDLHPDKPTFLIGYVPVATAPDTLGELKMTCLAGPDVLMSASTCPILKIGALTYWIYSFVDNREAMAILAFNVDGTLIQRWEKNGARYLVDLAVHPENNTVIIIGQGSRQISVLWEELTAPLRRGGVLASV